MNLTLAIHRPDGTTDQVPLLCRVDTVDEVAYFQHGGILPYVLPRDGKGSLIRGAAEGSGRTDPAAAQFVPIHHAQRPAPAPRSRAAPRSPARPATRSASTPALAEPAPAPVPAPPAARPCPARPPPPAAPRAGTAHPAENARADTRPRSGSARSASRRSRWRRQSRHGRIPAPRPAAPSAPRFTTTTPIAIFTGVTVSRRARNPVTITLVSTNAGSPAA